jgi:phospholipid/cholesterol/gamma-HCH transport system substrate-binding protein
MVKNVVDTLVGVFIIVAAVFVCSDWFIRARSPGARDHYELRALFTDMTGLEVGSSVKISGIPVGYVSGYDLDANSYLANVVATVHNSVRVPVDSTASIASEGLFGRKYLKISPGMQKVFYKGNDVIEITEPALNMEAIISGLLFSKSAVAED